MAKQYAKTQSYKAKLKRVMTRLGIESYNYNWGRFDCWVEFSYKGNSYKFYHGVENAKLHGVNIKYGSDAFAQLILSLEDLARMVERGIYDLPTWVAGMKFLPEKKDIPDCFKVLQFSDVPLTWQEVDKQFKRLVKVAHPDNGGTQKQFIILQEAKEEASAYFV